MIKSNKRVKIGKQPDYLKMVIEMKKYELEMIKETIDRVDVMKEDAFREYFFRMFPNRSERYYYYYLLDFYRRNIFYKYDVNKLKASKDRLKFNFELNIDYALKACLERIHPSIIISIWNLYDLSNFMSLQLFSNIIIVETNSYAKEIVVNCLLDMGKIAVYEEDYFTMMKYQRNREIYVVRSINEDSPVVRRSVTHVGRNIKPSIITVPKIEKILVDILVEDFYITLLGDEISSIYFNILKKYQINMSTIFRYAKKRYSYQKVRDFQTNIGFDCERGEFE